MQFIIFDEDFQTMGSIKVFNTLMWYRRYYEPGIFELHIPADYFDLVNTGKYLYRNDRTELGVIREVNFMHGEKNEKTAYCKGFFAEHLLNNSVMYPTFNKTGKPDVLGQEAVKMYLVNPADGNRRIRADIRMGKLKGLGTSIILQNTGDEVGTKLYEVLQTQEMSQRLVFDYLENSLTYEVWQGKDRTESQTENSWAIFSDSFRNIKNAQYDRDKSDCKNVAYVAGEGEGSARIVVEVDVRSSPDEERRELWVDARDLQQTSDTFSYSDSQYREMLRQRGLEKLAEFAMLEKVDSDIDLGANLVYGTDFDLGDLCTYQYSDMNIECSKRITEIQEVLEGSSRTLSVIFGSDTATNFKKIIRKETM
ncbi:MAG: siphovirus ReqiPepy6 Gp37-like family protein [Roseburia sp.]|nr:siphovirus ReqiPepy6 Gp37-like family protein [Roseburia sp.]